MTSLISVFSSIILLATVTTLAIALFAYIAYKVRERRKPDHAQNDAKGKTLEPVFLKRHMIEDIVSPAPGDPSIRTREPPTPQAPEDK